MISGILTDILMYILFTSFILGFLGACIYLIIDGVREYLENTEGLYLFQVVMGCIGIMLNVIIILKTFGL